MTAMAVIKILRHKYNVSATLTLSVLSNLASDDYSEMKNSAIIHFRKYL